MQDTQRPINKNYRLQNAHNNGFEFTLSTTNDSRRLNEKFTKKQHFVQGRVSLLRSFTRFLLANWFARMQFTANYHDLFTKGCSIVCANSQWIIGQCVLSLPPVAGLETNIPVPLMS